jgi:hypothetical protein
MSTLSYLLESLAPMVTQRAASPWSGTFLVGHRHEPGQRGAAKDAVVRQGHVGDVEDDVLRPIILSHAKCYWQHDLP